MKLPENGKSYNGMVKATPVFSKEGRSHYATESSPKSTRIPCERCDRKRPFQRSGIEQQIWFGTEAINTDSSPVLSMVLIVGPFEYFKQWSLTICSIYVQAI